MEDETKIRFDELDKRLSSSEKRFDDIKWYFGGVTGVFMIVFSLLTIILSWNYKSEKESLREFQKDIKTELGKIESPPQLEINGPNGKPMNNQEVTVDLLKEESEGKTFYRMTIYFFLRNIGNSPSGPINGKIYTNEPIVLRADSTDEPNFHYEDYWLNKYLEPNELPGQFSCQLNYTLYLLTERFPPKGKYPALFKIFYGKGKIAQAHFTIIVDHK
jgi:hypothetical protein